MTRSPEERKSSNLTGRRFRSYKKLFPSCCLQLCTCGRLLHNCYFQGSFAFLKIFLCINSHDTIQTFYYRFEYVCVHEKYVLKHIHKSLMPEIDKILCLNASLRMFATLLNMLISCFLTDRIHSSDWCFPRLWNTKLLCGKIN